MRLMQVIFLGDDFARVWKMHCSNDRLLQDYSAAMNQLATNVWDVDCDGRDRTKVYFIVNLKLLL